MLESAEVLSEGGKENDKKNVFMPVLDGVAKIAATRGVCRPR